MDIAVSLPHGGIIGKKMQGRNIDVKQAISMSLGT